MFVLIIIGFSRDSFVNQSSVATVPTSYGDQHHLHNLYNRDDDDHDNYDDDE